MSDAGASQSLYEGLPAIFYDRICKRSHWNLLKGERIMTNSDRAGEVVGVKVNQHVVAIRVRFGEQVDRYTTAGFARFRAMSLSAASAVTAGLTGVLPTLTRHDIDVPTQEAGRAEKAGAISANGTKDANKMAIIQDVVRTCGIDFLYHMTHLDNVPSILERGIFSHDEAPCRKDISLSSVQERRTQKTFGGHAYDLHRYACLYFNPRNAMLFYRREIQDSIALVKVSPEVLTLRGTLITNGNAAATRSQLVELDELHTLDWRTIRDRYWTDNIDGEWVANEERKSQMMAEALVPKLVPVDLIIGLACNCQATADLLSKVAGNIPVITEPRLYF